MNTSIIFDKQWQELFPSDSTPFISCLSENGYDGEGVVNEINKYNIEIKKLKKELEQKEFIVRFLNRLVNGDESSFNNNTADLDTASNDENFEENPGDRSPPIISPVPVSHSPSFNIGGVTRRSKKNTKPVPAPRPSLKEISALLGPESTYQDAEKSEILSNNPAYPPSILRGLSTKTTEVVKKQNDEPIYDLPIINPKTLDKSDESSEDEENNPVYWNVLMMKHRSLDSSKLYANLEKGNLIKSNLPSECNPLFLSK